MDAQQIRDLDLVHLVNLDAIARGEADEAILWDVFGGNLTWSRVADSLQMGVDEMRAQLALVVRLAERYKMTDRVIFTGPEYQLAKDGVDVMRQLAEHVDLHTAIAAAEWSEARIQELAA